MDYNKRGHVYSVGVDNPTYNDEHYSRQRSDPGYYPDSRSRQKENKGSKTCCIVVFVIVLILVIALTAVLLWVFVFNDKDDKDKSDEVVTDSISGEIVINDDTNWAYVSNLANADSSQYEDYQRRFCDEATSADYFSSIDESCSVGEFREGSLHVSFTVEIPRPDDDNRTDTQREEMIYQASLHIINVFIDNMGDIRNVPAEDITIGDVEVSAVHGIVTLDDEVYDADYANPDSQAFQDFEERFCDVILDDQSLSSNCHIRALASGSVQVFYSVTKMGQTAEETVIDSNAIRTTLEQTTEFDVSSNLVADSFSDICTELACQQVCNDALAIPACECDTGYVFAPGGDVCIDVDECVAGQDNCEQLCTNTLGSFVCECPPGYTLQADGFSCIDTNECAGDSHGCTQNCDNTLGSYTCSCFDGYELENDICEDIDECDLPNNDCEHDCENTDGSYVCTCPSGYTLNDDGLTCGDVDECAQGTDNCAQRCVNTEGAYSCVCSDGYEGDGFNCRDIDECASNNGGCEDTCTNSEGSFTCGCSGDQFACFGGHCIAGSLRCDGSDDCSDLSDEKGCECDDPSSEVQCDTGPCIPAHNWCDGNADCMDGSDEKRECPSGCPPSTLKCFEDFVRFKCLHQDFVCDGEVHCLGAADEINCGCRDFGADECHWGLCIDESLRKCFLP